MKKTRKISTIKDQQFQDNQQLEVYHSKQLQSIQKFTQIQIDSFPLRKLQLQPPRQIPKRAYSLEADMATGWKPRKNARVNLTNVFPLNFSHEVVDDIVKQLAKNKSNKNVQNSIVYLGPRPINSYNLHQNRQYPNPYPIDKKVQQKNSQRSFISNCFKPRVSKLSFDSNFQGGNLDVAIQVDHLQYDLFMRVDSNTKGHTNWYHFEVKNEQFIGTIKFNLCNFKRQKSLYQRELKPFVKSLKQTKGQWKQDGKKVKYQRKNLRYKFLYDEDEDQQQLQKLKTYFTLSFEYDFEIVNDKVQFAYCVPYTYSRLNKFLSTLENIKQTQLCKTLSGLPIPVIQVTDHQIPHYEKQVILVTARIHPGQSNSSHVVQGFISFISSNQSNAAQLRKIYHFFVVPMLNPDGVVAGNYRTSLFGKDLNRTFNQNRKFAFPQTFHLIQFVDELKKTHKQRFSIYLDLHGHSVKKNVFMYGPDFNIAHSFYSASRQFPRILGNITSMFRFYSCSFCISSQKSSTARAIFNRIYKIPFTYTMQSSNGIYFDAVSHCQRSFTAQKWRQMGMYVAQALLQLKLNLTSKKVLTSSPRKRQFFQSKNFSQTNQISDKFKLKQMNEKYQKNSDDQISEGKSDAQSQDEDLPDQQLNKLQALIVENKQQITESSKQTQSIKALKDRSEPRQLSPRKEPSRGAPFCNLRQDKQKLPPIFTQNRQSFFAAKIKKKRLIFHNQRHKNMSAIQISNKRMSSQQIKTQRARLPIAGKINNPSMSQIITDVKSQLLSIQQNDLLMNRLDMRKQIKRKLFSQRYY